MQRHDRALESRKLAGVALRAAEHVVRSDAAAIGREKALRDRAHRRLLEDTDPARLQERCQAAGEFRGLERRAMRRVDSAERSVDARALGERIGIEPAEVLLRKPVLAIISSYSSRRRSSSGRDLAATSAPPFA